MSKSVFQSIIQEANQSSQLRQPRLQEIEKFFDRKVVSFYTSFSSPKGAISDNDVEMLGDILSGLELDKQKLLLIIDSPGGDPLAAERFVKVCREFSGNDFWVVVPGKAKSAATMISLGASKIIMTNTSELGPIDVQVNWHDDLVPAHIIITAYEELLQQGIGLPENKRIEPILQQLQVFNAPQIERLKLARDLSREIAIKVLKEGMFKDVPKKEMAQLLQVFVNPDELKDHGRPVFYSDLAEIDKNGRFHIETMGTDHPAFDAIHEYHLRAKFHMGGAEIAKLFETVSSAFTA